MASSKVITRNDVQNILAHINLGDDSHQEITQADFDALSDEEKNSGTIYFITNGINNNIFLDDNTPIGTIAPYGGSSDPAYWLICDGRAVSRTVYADLFTVIGTTYGIGDGSTTFNIPDLRGKTAVGAGQGTNLTNRILGSTGGEELHTLNTNEIPAHTHGSKSLSGSHRTMSNNSSASGIVSVSDPSIDRVYPSSGSSMGAITFTVNATHEHTSVGGSQAHNNMQPYIVTNYIIKAQSALSENQSQLDFFYPVGSYYETSNINFNPNIIWGGVWEQLNKKEVLQGVYSASISSIGTYNTDKLFTLQPHTKYLLIGDVSSNNGSTIQYYSIFNILTNSDSLRYQICPGIQPTNGSGGHYNPIAYIETSELEADIRFTSYIYVSATYNWNAWAIPLQCLDESFVKWHRIA